MLGTLYDDKHLGFLTVIIDIFLSLDVLCHYFLLYKLLIPGYSSVVPSSIWPHQKWDSVIHFNLAGPMYVRSVAELVP